VQYLCKCTFIEIYNEKVFDILESVPTLCRKPLVVPFSLRLRLDTILFLFVFQIFARISRRECILRMLLRSLPPLPLMPSRWAIECCFDFDLFAHLFLAAA